MKTLSLNYTATTATGDLEGRNVPHEWPDGATRLDVMVRNNDDLQRAGCDRITTTLAGVDSPNVPCETLTINSKITPERVHFHYYPAGQGQFHVTILRSPDFTSGAGIFLTKANARDLRAFLNRHYPDEI